MKLDFAAPASFLSPAAPVQAVNASAWHFFMKLVFAAPASFLSLACEAQVGWSAQPLTAISEMAAARIRVFKSGVSFQSWRTGLPNPEPALEQANTQGQQIRPGMRWHVAIGRQPINHLRQMLCHQPGDLIRGDAQFLGKLLHHAGA
jgi:hypothetical protein